MASPTAFGLMCGALLTGCAGRLEGNWTNPAQGSGEPAVACTSSSDPGLTLKNISGRDDVRRADGDILLPQPARPASGLHHLHPTANAIAPESTPVLFPDGVIHYKVRDDVDPAEVRAAIDAWESRWTGTPSAPHFAECEGTCAYTVFIDENRGTPECGSSAVGKAPAEPRGDYQIVYLPGRTDMRCRDVQRTARHELGHLLGLYHEQQRSDRDAYIRLASCSTELSRQQLAIDFGNAAGRAFGRYDFRSIMHYPGSAEGYPTITLANGQSLPSYTGTTTDISAGDVAAVLALYAPSVATPALLGGSAHLGSPASAVAVSGAGEMIAVRGSNEHLQLRESNARCGGWCDWEDTGIVAGSSPALATTADDRVIAAFFNEARDRVCFREADGSSGCPLAAPHGFTFTEHDAPALAAGLAARVVILARASSPDSGTALFVSRRGDAGAFSTWTRFSNQVTGTPAVVSHDGASYDAFWVSSSDGGLHTLLPTRWGFPQGARPSAGIPFRSGVTVISRAPGQFEIFVLGNDDLIWSMSGNNGQWSGWAVRGGPARSLPGAALTTSGEVELVFAGPLGPTIEVAPYAFDPLEVDGAVWSASVHSALTP